jgi:PBP1b-binding outer membrane lipoprotein LpoB
MSRQRRTRTVTAIAILALLPAGCVNPNSLASLQAQLNEAADAMNSLRLEIGTLHTSLDSMNVVLAKQDTTIQRLANAAGIPIAR